MHPLATTKPNPWVIGIFSFVLPLSERDSFQRVTDG
jgi:hypothetical protein